jgi:hypothetical protein
MSDSFIFNPKQQPIEISSQSFYCLPDHADFIDNSNTPQSLKEHEHTLAKKITKENNIIYQIKIANNNQLFNPFSKFDRETSYSFLDNVVRPSNKFMGVNQLVFDFYLKFLNTQNTAWLNKAERERA